MILGLRKMGYGSWILHLILLLIFTLISFHYTHFLIMGDSFNAEKFFNTHDLQQVTVYGGRRENHIEKVSGEVGKQENEPLFLQKFRTLLGVKFFKFNQRRRPFDGDVQYGSPSPSPLPSIEAPAPTPVHPLHSHAPRRRPRWIPSSHKIHKEEGDDNGRVKRILVAVLVSAGATSILSLAGLFWGCRKFRKQRKRSSASTVAMYNSEGGGARSKSKYVSSQNSVKKVTSDPGPDLFYLESLGTALEPISFCLKQNSETVSTTSNQNTSLWALNEVEEAKKDDSIKIELEEGSSSAVGEIVSVHDSVESVRYEAVNSSSPSRENIIPVESHYSSDDESIKYGDVEKVIPAEDHESFDDESIKNDVDIIIPVEAHYSSDDESFHSFCNSHSSNPRLSNASMGSLSDKSEIVSPNLSKESPFSAPPPVKLAIPSPSPVPPPPPPPPPPLRRVHISPSYSTSSSTRIKYKASSFSALPNLSSSPRNSDSSSGSNQTPKNYLPLSPPNPSRPPVGIPPPPFPPPFTKGSLNSLKGPPPPPSLFPRHTPLGKDGSPLPKLKPLHWDKVRAASDRSMVWDKLKSSSFEFDEQMIESLFGYNLQNSMKNEEAKSKSPSPSKHVLEPKRLQNITILSKALNVTAEQVCHALIQGNGLCLQQLEALSKMEPTKEEETKLTSYKGNSNELGSAEKFVAAMLKIPYAFQRIEAMLYRETFEDEVVHLRKSFSMLEEACKELRSSRLFLKLLEAVLKTGNRMNVGTIRGGARAFKLDTLLKLSDVKGTDGKTTLLHFVVQEIVRSEGIRVSESIIGKINQKSRRNVEDKEEDYRRMGLDLVAGLTTELCNVKKTATIDLDVLASSVSNLSDGMTKLQRLITRDSSMEEKSGNFAHSMTTFLIYAERNLKELREDERKVLLHVREITEYFHGNVSKEEANPLRIFVIVRDFLGMLGQVCRELRSLKVPSSPNPLAPFR